MSNSIITFLDKNIETIHEINNECYHMAKSIQTNSENMLPAGYMAYLLRNRVEEFTEYIDNAKDDTSFTPKGDTLYKNTWIIELKNDTSLSGNSVDAYIKLYAKSDPDKTIEFHSNHLSDYIIKTAVKQGVSIIEIYSTEKAILKQTGAAIDINNLTLLHRYMQDVVSKENIKLDLSVLYNNFSNQYMSAKSKLMVTYTAFGETKPLAKWILDHRYNKDIPHKTFFKKISEKLSEYSFEDIMTIKRLDSKSRKNRQKISDEKKEGSLRLIAKCSNVSYESVKQKSLLLITKNLNKKRPTNE